MAVIFYYRCENCNTVYAVNPEDSSNQINTAPDFEERLFSDVKLPLGENTGLLHACDNHTFGPAKFIYGKRFVDPEEI